MSLPLVKCPCCGSMTPITPEVIRARLPGVKRRIYDIVRKRHPSGISAKILTELVYADDPEGGPESTNCVHVHVGHINKIISDYGWQIKARRGASDGYKLVKL